MAFRKKSLRRMSPTARKVARLAGELDSVATRLKNMITELQHLDLDSAALKTATQPKDMEIVKRKLESIRILSGITYTEIHNPEAINHTINLINEHTLQALEILS